MKKEFLFVLVLLVMCLSNNSNLYAYCEDDGDDDPEEIELQEQNGNAGPTSLNQFGISAYKTSSFVYVDVFNYSGNVSVFIGGIGGSVYSNQNPIVGSGRIIVDISSLPSGLYFVFIQANQLYQGSFTK